MQLFFGLLRITQTGGIIITILILSPVLLFIVPIVVHRIKNGHRISYWNEQGLPIYYPFNKETLVEMYIAFGCLLSFREVNDSLKNKLVWIHQYLKENFPDVDHRVSESYEGVRNNGLNLNQMVSWCYRKVQNEQLVKLVEYLVRLAFSNEDLNSNESVFILYVMKQWRIDVNELDQEAQDILLGRREGPKSFVNKSRTYYLGVLGLEEGVTASQVKRAYRKLVKIYHPDNNLHLETSEKKAYVAKFMEIQQAYEIIDSGVDFN